ncbi:AAA family ATPase [Providencia sp. PROV188]|uniref:AAA family ATPase n=1 Tax=Providencia sp. PROV188 TaxID=2939731 RepID=UPI0022DD3DD6|nr:AAA family ATPase [Providencia sp. PROV188]WBM62285.1 AAA family ATPase [Providencia sp. PROV188]
MKICIIGISGAGKTTLAQKLSEEFNLPAYGYDDIYWNKTQMEYVKNTPETMNSLISEIKSKESWIMEGSYDKRLAPFFVDCSLIIRLNIPYRVCAFRIIKRFLISQLKGMRPKETLMNTLELLRFAKHFDQRLDEFFAANPIFAEKVKFAHDTPSCFREIANYTASHIH